MLACEKMEKEIEKSKKADETTLNRRNKKRYQELVAGKELELNKQLTRFKTRQESILIGIQTKWQVELEKERKKTLHDNINLSKESETKLTNATIVCVQTRPDKSIKKSIFGSHTKSNYDGIEKKFNVSIK